MVYYRCRCGKREVWSSGEMPARCSPCGSCGSVPADSPSAHPDPIPHAFVPEDLLCSCMEDPGVSEETRELHHPSRCSICHRTRAEIARRAMTEGA